VERTRAHLLTDILMISILAVMAGAQGWEDIETYGLSKQAWLEEFGLAQHPLCRYVSTVFERIDPKAFEQCFQRWVGTLVERLGAQVIPIDGKTLKGSQPGTAKKCAACGWCMGSEHRKRARTGESL